MHKNHYKVKTYLESILADGTKLHWTLIDPDKQKPYEAGETAKLAEESGTDAFLVGGSTGVTLTKLYNTLNAIKKQTNVPVIIFPTSSKHISNKADAILFTTLLNSKNKKYIVDIQRDAVKGIYQYGLDVLPVGYIIIKPGMEAGKIGEADLIKRKDTDLAVDWALTAQYKGMEFIYLDAGSGAPKPVPKNMIGEVKKHMANDNYLIVGGGIRSAGTAKEIADAGADIIVTGTIIEKTEYVKPTLVEIISAVKE